MDSADLNEHTLGDFFKALAEAKKAPKPEPIEVIEEEVIPPEPQITFQDFFNAVIEEKTGKIPSPIVKEATKLSMESIAEEILKESLLKADKPMIIQEQLLGLFGGDASVKTVDPLTPLNQNFVTTEDLQKHYKTFIQRVQQQLSTIGGGGETHFLQLDDFNKRTKNDNWVLEYDAATDMVQFTDEIGPIQAVIFDSAHINDHTIVGTLCWSINDHTLNLHHPGGVTQQIGQEQYMLARNHTGSTLQNGEYMMFAGATGTNGEARLLAAPFLANGTYPNLYGMGVATQDIADGAEGFVTTFGKVRDLNTTGSDVGESWEIGNILYANPIYAGKLTRYKPTAPNNVIPVASVLVRDETGGEIFVRPTYEQRVGYGRFTDTTNQTPTAINTPKAITFNTTNISEGVYLGTPTSRIYVEQSGFYRFNIAISLTSTNSAAKNFYYWMRKNGVDIENSAHRQTLVGNSVYELVADGIALSLDANDYVEIYYASSDLAVTIDAPPATSFTPAATSIAVLVTQVAQ